MMPSSYAHFEFQY